VEDLGLSPAKLSLFFAELELGYPDSNPYHNRAHAASVMHAMHAFLEHGGLAAQTAPSLFDKDVLGKDGDAAARGSLQLTKMACLLAAAIHDYGHEGVNNDYLVKTRHERAILYNDAHVNENHHVAAAFDLLLRPKNNFLAHLSDKEFRCFRALVVDLVIATDMADNSKFVGALAAAAERREDGVLAPKGREEAVLLLQVAMKCADLGHLALDWSMHLTWVTRLEQEFFEQGDMESEAGLPISFLMDRQKPGASETQVGFFDFVVLPLFRSLARAAPRVEPFVAAAADNYARWKELDASKAKE